ncbi:hypothetical protein ACTJIJ_14790 [Niabella sp. 22666]|uniref:hypothetical protein n=1 Tax=Niabella sp. 22666 TaxID=3453954 RepID=UPI003F82C152
MQSIITWNQLLSYLFILLIIYYAAVLAVCYRQEVLRLASRFKRPGDLSAEEEDFDDQETGVSKREQDSTIYDTVHQLMQDWKIVFSNVTNAPIHKDKLIEELHKKARNYPAIKSTSFEVSLTNHVQQEADYRLGIILTEEEIAAIWK